MKILCKSRHFRRRYKRKHEWVFFSEHSVLCYDDLNVQVMLYVTMAIASKIWGQVTGPKGHFTSPMSLLLRRNSLP